MCHFTQPNKWDKRSIRPVRAHSIVMTTMPMPLLTDIKGHIVKWYFEDQYTMAEIAEWAECSIGLVSNVLHNHWELGQVNNPFKCYTSHPTSLTKDDLNFISMILSANPSLYLDEIQQKLEAVQEDGGTVVERLRWKSKALSLSCLFGCVKWHMMQLKEFSCFTELCKALYQVGGKLVIYRVFRCALVHSWAEGFPHASELPCPGFFSLWAITTRHAAPFISQIVLYINGDSIAGMWGRMEGGTNVKIYTHAIASFLMKVASTCCAICSLFEYFIAKSNAIWWKMVLGDLTDFSSSNQPFCFLLRWFNTMYPTVYN